MTFQVKAFILFIQNFPPQILHWDVNNWDTKQNHTAQRTAQAISGLLFCADLCENSITSYNYLNKIKPYQNLYT